MAAKRMSSDKIVKAICAISGNGVEITLNGDHGFIVEAIGVYVTHKLGCSNNLRVIGDTVPGAIRNLWRRATDHSCGEYISIRQAVRSRGRNGRWSKTGEWSEITP